MRRYYITEADAWMIWEQIMGVSKEYIIKQQMEGKETIEP